MSAKAGNQANYKTHFSFDGVNWKRFSRVSILLLSLTVLAWFIVFLLKPDTLPIKQIRAQGTFKHVDETMLHTVVKDSIQGGYFNINVDVIKNDVEKMPWIDHVSVSRVWPDTVLIHITEQKAFARWQEGGVVNFRGELFQPNKLTINMSLPVLDGPRGTERNLTEYYLLAQEIIAPLDVDIKTVRMDARRAIRIELNNGIEIVLGREDLEDRLQRFSRIYMKVLSPRADEIKSVDMRYSNGLAVDWRS